MSEIFQVAPKQSARATISCGKEDITARYAALQGEFLSSSYGYYATHFVQKIAAEAVVRSPQSEILSIIKLLRELVRKFLLSDLELVFVGYVAGQLEWSFSKPFYKQRSQILQMGEQLHRGVDVLNYFLYLCAYFVKNYIGQLQEATAITDLLGMELGGDWQLGYEEWLKTLPSQLFKLSPRAINSIFRTYTRDCLKSVQSKNYNSMVDRVLELSTTYSMIPGDAKHKKKQQIPQIFEESSSGRKLVKKNIVTDGNLSKRQSSLNEGAAIQSRLSSNFLEPRQKEAPSETKEPQKRGLLKLRTKNQQVSNHISEFYSKKQYESPAFREQFRPESTIGFQNSIPSLLDFNNRSSVYEAIPYTLRNNSNLSNFWK